MKSVENNECASGSTLDLLHEAEHKIKILTRLLDKSEVGTYVTDYNTCEILYVNRKMASYGDGRYTAEDMIGKLCWTYVNAEKNGRCPFCPYKKLVDSEGHTLDQPYEWERFFPQKNVWLKIISETIPWFDGRLAQMVTFYDISESKRTQEHLADLAFFDQKLRLKNSVRLEQDMRNSDNISLLILDIVALQKVNDAFGRTIGDDLLISVRNWLQNLSLPNSELYRIGGDEFVMTVQDLSLDELSKLAELLFERFNSPWTFKVNGSELSIVCSSTVGAIHSSYVNRDESLFNLIGRTFEVARNKDSVIVYSKLIDDNFKRQLQLEWSLKRSVYEKMNGFHVYYQPIAESISGRWIGLEALCRWDSREIGPVSPVTFIPEAERLALIDKIGIWVLETAVRDCKKWGLENLPGFVLNVNLSAVQFSDIALDNKVLNILSNYQFPHEKLCLEITESNRFTFTDLSLRIIESFRRNNILVALDDFGTGYSNFSNLKSLPIDLIKIERDFTADIESNNYHLYLFRAMTDLAHAANKKLIAEGVESISQMNLLVENGADFLQGYLFSRPVPPSSIQNCLYRFELAPHSL